MMNSPTSTLTTSCRSVATTMTEMKTNALSQEHHVSIQMSQVYTNILRGLRTAGWAFVGLSCGRIGLFPHPVIAVCSCYSLLHVSFVSLKSSRWSNGQLSRSATVHCLASRGSTRVSSESRKCPDESGFKQYWNLFLVSSSFCQEGYPSSNWPVRSSVKFWPKYYLLLDELTRHVAAIWSSIWHTKTTLVKYSCFNVYPEARSCKYVFHMYLITYHFHQIYGLFAWIWNKNIKEMINTILNTINSARWIIFLRHVFCGLYRFFSVFVITTPPITCATSRGSMRKSICKTVRHKHRATPLVQSDVRAWILLSAEEPWCVCVCICVSSTVRGCTVKCALCLCVSVQMRMCFIVCEWVTMCVSVCVAITMCVFLLSVGESVGIDAGDNVKVGVGRGQALRNKLPCTPLQHLQQEFLLTFSVTYLLIPFTIRTQEQVSVTK